MAIDTTDLRKLASPAYLIAGLMIFIPIMDLGSNMIPIRFSDPAWRYGAIGLGSGFLLTPMLGMILGVFVAGIAGQGKMARTLGWINLVGAVILIPLGGLFLLDAIQVRGAVLPEAVAGFDVGVVKALVKISTAIIAFGWLGLAAKRVRVRTSRDEESFLRPPS